MKTLPVKIKRIIWKKIEKVSYSSRVSDLALLRSPFVNKNSFEHFYTLKHQLRKKLFDTRLPGIQTSCRKSAATLHYRLSVSKI